MGFQPLPVGVENFEKFYTEDYYYVDKTWFIKELLDQKAEVNLFTRPRRFGKTLTLSMLKYFFEDVYDSRGHKKSYRHLFEGKKIMDAGERYLRHMGQYPVIFLSLKSGKQSAFDSCMSQLRTALAEEFDRHSYILKEKILSPKEEMLYEAYRNETLSFDEYKKSLKFLCRCLEKCSGKKVIILLDEYDVPLEGAYVYGFYDQMVDFIRELFGATLKTNDSLYFAVITGCLRISKESIFTGLNNLEINSIMTAHYGEYFGFTEDEVMQLCENFDLKDKYEEIKDWYNGYIFGKANVYNPWSTICYVKEHLADRNAFPRPYWVNTSSNSIVKDLICRASEEAKGQIGALLDGKTIEIPLHEDVTYDEVYKNDTNLWNFMFFTGYFKKVSERFAGRKLYTTLKIPNGEIEYIFEEKVNSWFQESVQNTNREALFHALIENDSAALKKEINALLMSTISFHDTKENFYHGFLAGILTGIQGYLVKSNREGGTGRSDLFIKPLDHTKTAYVIEIKVAKSIPELVKETKKALRQVADRGYEQELYEEGYLRVERYGIAFFKKNCEVSME